MALLKNLSTEDVCKWLEKEGVDATIVAHMRGENISIKLLATN